MTVPDIRIRHFPPSDFPHLKCMHTGYGMRVVAFPVAVAVVVVGTVVVCVVVVIVVLQPTISLLKSIHS